MLQNKKKSGFHQKSPSGNGRKPDLSLKCLSWKGFISCKEWKSPSPKQKSYGSEKIVSAQTILVLKTFMSKKFVGKKKLWAKLYFGS